MYDRVNREALWQVLKMYDVGGKFLNGINSMYANSLACIRVNGGESKCFKIDSGVQGFVVTLWCFNVYMDAVMKGGENGDGEDEWKLPGFMW